MKADQIVVKVEISMTLFEATALLARLRGGAHTDASMSLTSRLELGLQGAADHIGLEG